MITGSNIAYHDCEEFWRHDFSHLKGACDKSPHQSSLVATQHEAGADHKRRFESSVTGGSSAMTHVTPAQAPRPSIIILFRMFTSLVTLAALAVHHHRAGVDLDCGFRCFPWRSSFIIPGLVLFIVDKWTVFLS